MEVQPQVWCDAEVAEARGSQLVWERSLPAQEVSDPSIELLGSPDSQVD